MGDVTEFVEPEARPLLAIEDLSKGFTLHAANRRVRGCEHISLSVLFGFGQVHDPQVHLPHKPAGERPHHVQFRGLWSGRPCHAR